MSSVRSCYEMSYNSGGVGSWSCIISDNILLRLWVRGFRIASRSSKFETFHVEFEGVE